MILTLLTAHAFHALTEEDLKTFSTCYYKSDFDCSDLIVAWPMFHDPNNDEIFNRGKIVALPRNSGYSIGSGGIDRTPDYTADDTYLMFEKTKDNTAPDAQVIKNLWVEGLGVDEEFFEANRTVSITFANGVNVVYKQPRGQLRFFSDPDLWVRKHIGRNNSLSSEELAAAPFYIKIIRPRQPGDTEHQADWFDNLGHAIGDGLKGIASVYKGLVTNLGPILAAADGILEWEKNQLEQGKLPLFLTQGITNLISNFGNFWHNLHAEGGTVQTEVTVAQDARFSEMALLSQNSYVEPSERSKVLVSQNYKYLDIQTGDLSQSVNPSILDAASWGAYESNDGRELILAFRGTSGSLADIVADIRLATNTERGDTKFEQALATYDKLYDTHMSKYDTIAVTGHSLGGSLALHVSGNRDHTDLETWSFNPGLVFSQLTSIKDYAADKRNSIMSEAFDIVSLGLWVLHPDDMKTTIRLAHPIQFPTWEDFRNIIPALGKFFNAANILLRHSMLNFSHLLETRQIIDACRSKDTEENGSRTGRIALTDIARIMESKGVRAAKGETVDFLRSVVKAKAWSGYSLYNINEDADDNDGKAHYEDLVFAAQDESGDGLIITHEWTTKTRPF